MPSRAYSVTTSLDRHRKAQTVFAETASKARYAVLRNAREAGYHLDFGDLRVRSLGVRETPRERAERERDDFNARFPVGTSIRVYSGRMGDHSTAYDTTVKEPGAFIVGGPFGTQVSVKVPGDSIALTHVVPLVPLSGVEANQSPADTKKD